MMKQLCSRFRFQSAGDDRSIGQRKVFREGATSMGSVRRWCSRVVSSRTEQHGGSAELAAGHGQAARVHSVDSRGHGASHATARPQYRARQQLANLRRARPRSERLRTIEGQLLLPWAAATSAQQGSRSGTVADEGGSTLATVPRVEPSALTPRSPGKRGKPGQGRFPASLESLPLYNRHARDGRGRVAAAKPCRSPATGGSSR